MRSALLCKLNTRHSSPHSADEDKRNWDVKLGIFLDMEWQFTILAHLAIELEIKFNIFEDSLYNYRHWEDIKPENFLISSIHVLYVTSNGTDEVKGVPGCRENEFLWSLEWG